MLPRVHKPKFRLDRGRWFFLVQTNQQLETRITSFKCGDHVTALNSLSPFLWFRSLHFLPKTHPCGRGALANGTARSTAASRTPRNAQLNELRGARTPVGPGLRGPALPAAPTASAAPAARVRAAPPHPGAVQRSAACQAAARCRSRQLVARQPLLSLPLRRAVRRPPLPAQHCRHCGAASCESLPAARATLPLGAGSRSLRWRGAEPAILGLRCFRARFLLLVQNCLVVFTGMLKSI